MLGYWAAFRHGRVLGYWPAFRHGRVLGYWAAFRHGRVLGYWAAFRHRRVLGCADVGLADRDRRALAGPVIAGPREILIRPVIAERQETVVFVQVIGVDQASGPPGFYLGHRRRERRLLIPVIPGNGLGLRLLPGRVPELGLTRLPGLGLTRLRGLALTDVLGLAVLGLRPWPRGPRAGRAATQRCARTLALPSRPVLSHDPAYPPDDSLNSLT